MWPCSTGHQPKNSVKWRLAKSRKIESKLSENYPPKHALGVSNMGRKRKRGKPLPESGRMRPWSGSSPQQLSVSTLAPLLRIIIWELRIENYNNIIYYIFCHPSNCQSQLSHIFCHLRIIIWELRIENYNNLTIIFRHPSNCQSRLSLLFCHLVGAILMIQTLAQGPI